MGHKPVVIEGQIGIVTSRFNRPVTDALLAGAKHHLVQHGVSTSQLHTIAVPGALEIPLVIQHLFNQAREVNSPVHYVGAIALGAVIRGETTHYELVCQQVSQGCLQVGLTYNKPVIFGLLTTENTEQAWDRLGGNKGHKGEEAAQALLDMLVLLKQLSSKVFYHDH